MISVSINTYNRSEKLLKTIQSISKSSYKNFEIIIVDQSNTEHKNITKENINKYFCHLKIRYIENQNRNASKAKNIAIKKAKGDIIAFTDDDCIVANSWLETIARQLRENPSIDILFGRTVPYQPKLHKNEICPCTFSCKKEKVISKPSRHWINIGFGNNMVFRKKTFSQIGGFREWLGPGSIAKNAQDAEISLRALIKNYKILYSPKIKVSHNRWLSKIEDKNAQLNYSRGETACYGYFALQGHKFAKKIIFNNFSDSIINIKMNIKSLIIFKFNEKLFLYNLKKLINRFYGLLIGIIFTIKEPL